MPMKDALGARVVRAIPENTIYAFSSDMKPCMEISPGEVVVFETQDCFGGSIKGPQDKFEDVGWDRINPATGPIFVKGAEKGDTLCVEILAIEVNSPGVMTAVPGMGFAPDRITESTTTVVPVKNGLAHLPGDLVLETAPMIGVIGTAPGKGAPIPTGTPGTHGGNMDTKVIEAGATVYLPVAVEGALLAMGDLHALMGDGEVLVCGVEVGGSVKVVTRLHKGLTLPCPIVETDSSYFAVHSAETLDEAARGALDKGVDIMTAALGMSPVMALTLLSVKGNLQVSQVVDPLKTARLEIPKSILKGKSLVS